MILLTAENGFLSSLTEGNIVVIVIVVIAAIAGFLLLGRLLHVLVHLSYIERRSDRALDKLWDILQDATGKVSEELRKAVSKGDSGLYETAYDHPHHAEAPLKRQPLYRISSHWRQ